MALPCGEPAEHVRHRAPHMPDAGPAAALAGVDGDDVPVVHGGERSIIPGLAQQSQR